MGSGPGGPSGGGGANDIDVWDVEGFLLSLLIRDKKTHAQLVILRWTYKMQVD